MSKSFLFITAFALLNASRLTLAADKNFFPGVTGEKELEATTPLFQEYLNAWAKKGKTLADFEAFKVKAQKDAQDPALRAQVQQQALALQQDANGADESLNRLRNQLEEKFGDEKMRAWTEELMYRWNTTRKVIESIPNDKLTPEMKKEKERLAEIWKYIPESMRKLGENPPERPNSNRIRGGSNQRSGGKFGYGRRL